MDKPDATVAVFKGVVKEVGERAARLVASEAMQVKLGLYHPAAAAEVGEYATRQAVAQMYAFVADVDAVLGKLGNHDPDKDRHSGMLLIGSDPLRSFRKVFAMSDPKDLAKLVEELVTATEKAAHP